MIQATGLSKQAFFVKALPHSEFCEYSSILSHIWKEFFVQFLQDVSEAKKGERKYILFSANFSFVWIRNLDVRISALMPYQLGYRYWPWKYILAKPASAQKKRTFIAVFSVKFSRVNVKLLKRWSHRLLLIIFLPNKHFLPPNFWRQKKTKFSRFMLHAFKTLSSIPIQFRKRIFSLPFWMKALGLNNLTSGSVASSLPFVVPLLANVESTFWLPNKHFLPPNFWRQKRRKKILTFYHGQT